MLYVEAGGRGLVSLADHPEEWLPQALDALADFVRSGGPLRRLASSGSTASRCSARWSSRCWSSAASARARAALTLSA